MGKLIVFEGLDGSGKETQTMLYHSCLNSLGIQHKIISFPDYNSPSSALLKMYLHGDFGTADEVNPYIASTFYTADRYYGYKKKDWREFYENGGTLISDRYSTSNFIHQGAKFHMHQPELDTFLDWLDDFEYNKCGLPRPDKVIYLKIHPQISEKNLLKRYQGDTSKMDIHERDKSYMEICHATANYVADKYNWDIIPCSAMTEEGDCVMRDMNEIHTQIIEMIDGDMPH